MLPTMWDPSSLLFLFLSKIPPKRHVVQNHPGSEFATFFVKRGYGIPSFGIERDNLIRTDKWRDKINLFLLVCFKLATKLQRESLKRRPKYFQSIMARVQVQSKHAGPSTPNAIQSQPSDHRPEP